MQVVEILDAYSKLLGRLIAVASKNTVEQPTCLVNQAQLLSSDIARNVAATKSELRLSGHATNLAAEQTIIKFTPGTVVNVLPRTWIGALFKTFAYL